jgi:hypothetical protein
MAVAEVCSLMMTDGEMGAWGQDDPVPLRSLGVVGGYASMTKKRAEGFLGFARPDRDGRHGQKKSHSAEGRPETQSTGATQRCCAGGRLSSRNISGPLSVQHPS